MKRLLPLLGLLVALLAGVGLAVAAVPGEHEVVASACNTSSTPDRTIRLDTTDVATVPGAVATACVTATATAADTTTPGPTTTVTVTASPPPPAPWFSNSFEGDLSADVTRAPYKLAYANGGGRPFSSTYFKPVTGQSGQGLGLQVDSAETYDAGDLGPLTSLYTDAPDSHTAKGETTWYRVRFELPSASFIEGTGDFQWLEEWHENCNACGNSIGVGLSNWNASAHPQLYLRPSGGNGGAPTVENYYSASALNTPLGLAKDRWYDLVVGITWDTSAGGTGQISCYLDGVTCPLRKYVSSSNGDGPAWANPHAFPTLYTDGSTGAVDRPEFGLYNYRKPLAAGKSSRIDFDELAWGPTSASVGGTP